MLPLDLVAQLERGYRDALRRLDPPLEPSVAARNQAIDFIRSLDEGEEASSGEPVYCRLVQALGAGLSPEGARRVLRDLRPTLAHAFAYAVPNGRALERIAAAASVVEIGAGGGYWARCLSARGVQVVAFDRARARPPGAGPVAGRQLQHHEVRPGGVAEAFAEAPSAPTLLLCWPPGMLFHSGSGAPLGYSAMGTEALERFTGDTVAFVGERSKSFGSPAFFRRLRERFTLEQLIEIPNLGDWRDAVHIFRRR